MVCASDAADLVLMEKVYADICAILAPIIEAAIGWGLRDAATLSKGLALILEGGDLADSDSEHSHSDSTPGS
jgi:hypothetical protein